MSEEIVEKPVKAPRKPRTVKPKVEAPVVPAVDVKAVIKKVKAAPKVKEVEVIPEVKPLPKVRASRKPKVAPIAPTTPSKETIQESIVKVIKEAEVAVEATSFGKKYSKVINIAVAIIIALSAWFVGSEINKETPLQECNTTDCNTTAK